MPKHLLLTSAITLAIAACTTPPLTTPEKEVTAKLSDIWHGTADAPAAPGTVPMVPRLPKIVDAVAGDYLKIPPGLAGGTPINIPEEARKAPLARVILNLTAINNNAFPLQLRIFLAKESPYTTDQNPAILDMAAKNTSDATKTVNKELDPAIFKINQVYLGLGVSSSGSATPVTVSPEDTLVLKSSLTFQFKLL
ncbi:MAG: hypothetical protein HY692_03440 [Cyanobacteria bacterium NC_groundwater_1444_Ag_S-0.65um_54_12]|nr:hypothetical protein [Cyanobacteria bacterium NC_groundwater_1444_Ag_S-0.65um_54_12]